jgi:hypothetical protein
MGEVTVYSRHPLQEEPALGLRKLSYTNSGEGRFGGGGAWAHERDEQPWAHNFPAPFRAKNAHFDENVQNRRFCNSTFPSPPPPGRRQHLGQWR